MFEWDKINIAHIARHGVTPEEAEDVLLHDPSEAVLQIHNGGERYFQYGITREYRCLVVVTIWRSASMTRVVTAYTAPRALRRMYLEERGL